MINICNVSISYGAHKVIKDLSFEVRKGEIYGIIGPNGAGKTTMLRALSGIIHPDIGEISVDGQEVTKHRPKIAVLFENPMTADFLRLTAREDLMFYSVMYDIDMDAEKISNILKTVGLEHINKYVYTFSRGMWQRLYFARVLLPDFPVVILDEPWLGLDVAAQRETVDLLKEMKKMGRTIILTAHEMPLIERVCDRVMVLNNGSKIVEGDVEELLGKLEWRYEVKLSGEYSEKLEKYEYVQKDGYNYFYVTSLKDFIELMDISTVYEIDVKPLSLEEAYISLLTDV